MDWLGNDFGDLLFRVWAYLTTGRVLATILGAGFAILAISLLVASRTKWGQAKPLTKCVVVSVLLHVWLLMYALGTPKVLPQGDPDAVEQNISVSFEEMNAPTGPPSAPPQASASQAEQAVAKTVHVNNASDPISETKSGSEHESAWEDQVVPLADLPAPPELQALDLSQDLAPALLPSLAPTPMPALPPPEVLADLAQPAQTSEESPSHDSSTKIAVAMPDPPSTNVNPLPEKPEILPSDSSEIPVAPPPLSSAASSIASANLADQNPTSSALVASQSSPILAPQQQLATDSLPPEYRLRQAPNRLQLSQAYGADADSEAAVRAGLHWLSRAQSPSGGWIAAQFGAGTETFALGESRNQTGSRADTGVTGLALLAFLSAGHTHLSGEYRETVGRGLAYLLDAQMPSGDLSGPKQVGNDRSVLYARMYCHGIATLALAEAYAMTLDRSLKDALLDAAQYSINAQDVRGGGWRYQPGDPGDLSQFGWQAMALKSVERSGIRIPSEVQRRMRYFLDSCAAGTHGGLATYRPRQGRPSDTMTAEALACRFMLDVPLGPTAEREATQMLIANRPGTGEDNVYYWYYATMALFQLQDENWRRWNQALKSRLLATQVPAYQKEPGSWEPDKLWGGYGGRVYSTAMSCLCLEVYYRYLPMYQPTQLARTRPSAPVSR